MKMKSAKKKQNKAKKTVEQRQDLVMVKTESDLEEGDPEIGVNAGDFNIRIKEEPHFQEISEEHNGEPSEAKPDTVTAGSEVPNPQEHIKEECHPSCVKEELESFWFKGEEDNEGEAEAEAEAEEGEAVCTGRDSSLHSLRASGQKLMTNNTRAGVFV